MPAASPPGLLAAGGEEARHFAIAAALLHLPSSSCIPLQFVRSPTGFAGAAPPGARTPPAARGSMHVGRGEGWEMGDGEPKIKNPPLQKGRGYAGGEGRWGKAHLSPCPSPCPSVQLGEAEGAEGAGNGAEAAGGGRRWGVGRPRLLSCPQGWGTPGAPQALGEAEGGGLGFRGCPSLPLG